MSRRVAKSAPPPPASRTPGGGIKLVVFDFDQTLAVVHVFKLLAGLDDDGPLPIPPGPGCLSELGQMRRLQELNRIEAFQKRGGFAEVAFGGKERVEALHQFLGGLRKRGVNLVVCTKGLVGVARMCLSDLGLLEHFAVVYGRAGDSYGFTACDRALTQTKPSPREARLLGLPEHADWDSKANCISRIRARMDLEWKRVCLVDDDPDEIKRARHVCKTLWVKDAEGITYEHCQLLSEVTMPDKDDPDPVYRASPTERPGSRGDKAPTPVNLAAREAAKSEERSRAVWPGSGTESHKSRHRHRPDPRRAMPLLPSAADRRGGVAAEDARGAF
eukprot:TRINITY_DN17763_c0_g1_i2.p1 TRINITY_DN17763_c0_g1~~TRINITY_DN17763_c0_g1_i2.p1  ORF type:complete len:331 (+),score=47.99 TRINITY_DN17763_c0_g1_i2:88-1080(+)